MLAAVEAAADRNTYVAVHAYPPAAIRRALAVGVQCIEHGHLMDEATAKLIADKGVWLSAQPFLGEEDTGRLTGQSRLNALQVFAGANTLYPLAKEHKVKTAFGSDLLFSTVLASRQGVMLTHLRRWYDNVDILRMATGKPSQFRWVSEAICHSKSQRSTSQLGGKRPLRMVAIRRLARLFQLVSGPFAWATSRACGALTPPLAPPCARPRTGAADWAHAPCAI